MQTNTNMVACLCATLLLGLPAFAGDNCPATAIPGIHGPTSWDSYGVNTDFSGTTNEILYYDYKSPGTSLVDSTQSGCQVFTDAIKVYGAPYNTAYLIPGITWNSNDLCGTISGCDGYDDDGSLTATDRMALAVMNTTTGAGYVSKMLIDTTPYNASNSRYEFDASAGSNHAMYTMPAPTVTNVSCVTNLCDLTVSVPEPTFDGTGATGGLYGDNGTIAEGLLAGYKIVAIDSTGPTTGLASAWSAAIADQDRYIPASASKIGGTVSNALPISIDISTFTNSLYVTYVPVFNYATGCAANPCTVAEVAALDALGLSGTVGGAASAEVATTPVLISSFTGRFIPGNKVALKWVTSSEPNTIGFNLYRGPNAQNVHRINLTTIPAKGVGGAGATYQVTDTLPKLTLASYAYKLEQVDASGGIVDSVTITVKKGISQ